LEEIVLARLYLAEHRPSDVLALLERLNEAEEAAGRADQLLEILVLRAVAHDALGDVPAALGAVQRAVELGMPERFVRPFVEGGPAIRRLLSLLWTELARPGGHVRERGANVLRSYVESLLDAFVPMQYGQGRGRVKHPAAPRSSEQQIAGEVSAPTLTRRQLEVIRLIASGASNKDIGDTLVITPKTVKRHASNIYATLGVGSRTQAVARARTLGILPSGEQDRRPEDSGL
jgi:LuxR family maltose regulon positive regulatory protein